MNCKQSSSEERPIGRLMLLAAQFQTLTPGVDVEPVFVEFREALWQFIEVSADPNTHVLAWNTIDKWAKADLAEWQVTGNTEALERLKDKVQSALNLL